MNRSLINEIEQTREAMIIIGLKKGLAARETMELSRKLDLLMNQLKDCNCKQDSNGKSDGSYSNI